MRHFVVLCLLICTVVTTLAQDSQFNKHTYVTPLYVFHPVRFETDSSVTRLQAQEPRTSESLFLVEQDGAIKEITKAEFEELAKNAARNIKYLKFLDSSNSVELYGPKGRNGVMLVGLKNRQPSFSEEFLVSR